MLFVASSVSQRAHLIARNSLCQKIRKFRHARRRKKPSNRDKLASKNVNLILSPQSLSMWIFNTVFFVVFLSLKQRQHANGHTAYSMFIAGLLTYPNVTTGSSRKESQFKKNHSHSDSCRHQGSVLARRSRGDTGLLAKAVVPSPGTSNCPAAEPVICRVSIGLLLPRTSPLVTSPLPAQHYIL